MKATSSWLLHRGAEESHLHPLLAACSGWQVAGGGDFPRLLSGQASQELLPSAAVAESGAAATVASNRWK